MITLAERLRAREAELAEEIAGRYRTEIVDYAASDPVFVETDVLHVTRRGVAHVIENIAADSTKTGSLAA